MSPKNLHGYNSGRGMCGSIGRRKANVDSNYEGSCSGTWRTPEWRSFCVYVLSGEANLRQEVIEKKLPALSINMTITVSERIDNKAHDFFFKLNYLKFGSTTLEYLCRP